VVCLIINKVILSLFVSLTIESFDMQMRRELHTVTWQPQPRLHSAMSTLEKSVVSLVDVNITRVHLIFGLVLSVRESKRAGSSIVFICKHKSIEHRRHPIVL